MKRLTFFPPSGEVSLTNFRARIGEYVDAVEKGRESYILTRRGKQLARLVPMDDTSVVLSNGTVLGETPLTAEMAPEVRARIVPDRE